ncbi:Uronate isomerase [Indibacter alkaliphilus LW1]|uniref:Uronate isomerase n=1 Tax=Indibacter alkaliphilus (strain CCUG 57479 / KCTC 22604 / LW1) TaxID=1189612 RepID=S2E8M8_INDAL|nr:glucuronate isomerase [Indibacter alkaliphilus]EOZ98653.1 Uronate isomerase [Indibacter alkaliphilus LW1]
MTTQITAATHHAFISEHFLLENEFSKRLYHEYAFPCPIIDYHNHLPPDAIAENKVFENLSQIWLAGDHYKWRAMRTLGVDESFITGNAPDQEKFMKWAESVPYTLRNPLYHWTHLELLRYFEEPSLLDEKSGPRIYDECTSKINSSSFSTLSLMEKMKVETVCTTDDPADDLKHHMAYAKNEAFTKMYPTFRPDKSFSIENPSIYKTYLQKLGNVAKIEIKNYSDLLQALKDRVDFFHENGCRLSDHGLEKLYFFENEKFNPEHIFAKVTGGSEVSQEEIQFFKFNVLSALCKMYHSKGWTQQFHLGAMRNNNSRKFGQLGPDTGFDSIGDYEQATALSRFLDHLDKGNHLCKTVIYNLNPSDNEIFATMSGNFNDGSIRGKIQFGSGWWFLDQKDGMERQINTLSNMGLVATFVGMLTDSRSFLSFPRHEYFRRILCNLFGRDMQKGELPRDEVWVGKIIQDICYHNAKNYFNFP